MKKYEVTIKGNDTFTTYYYIDAKSFLEASQEAQHILRATTRTTIESIDITSICLITV